MRQTIKWPKAGDNPFLTGAADPQSPTWVNLSWLSNLRVNDSFLAEGFKEAADKIVDQLEKGASVRHPDIYFLPIAFLYRHSFELQMKHIIRLGLDLGLISSSENIDQVLTSHKLASLWHHARQVIVACWKDGHSPSLSGASAIIQKFHEADSSGQGFRYTKDANGESTLAKLPESVSLIQLRDTSEALFNLLDGCISGLENALELENEMRAEYASENAAEQCREHYDA